MSKCFNCETQTDITEVKIISDGQRYICDTCYPEFETYLTKVQGDSDVQE